MPGFLFGNEFFQPFWTYPGGLSEYAGAFLAHCEHADLLGASAAALLAGLLFLGTYRLFDRGFGVVTPWLAAVPPVVFFVMLDSYEVSTMKLGLRAALVFGAALIVARIGKKGGGLAPNWKKVTANWALVGLSFYVAGGLASLLLAFLCVLLSVSPCALETPREPNHGRPLADSRARGSGTTAKGHWMAFACLGASLLFPVVLWLVIFPQVPLRTLIELPEEGWTRAAAALLYGYVPAALALLAIGGRLQSELSRLPSLLQLLLRRGFGPALILTGAVCTWMAVDSDRRTSLLMDRYAAQKRWTDALTTAAGQPRLSRSAKLNVIRALFHSGRLAESMFAFSVPADLEQLLALDDRETLPVQSRTLLELGHLNLAKHFAHEALETRGEQPQLLKLLARINALKGRMEAAQVFLNALQRVPFHGTAAARALSCLKATGREAEDAEAAEINARLVKSDQPGSKIPIENLLRQSLHSEPRNRMAFEYLMSQYLLTFQLERFVAELGRLGDLGYSKMPRHYQEALLLYRGQPGTSVPVDDRTIQPEIARRFQEFVTMSKQPESQTTSGTDALRLKFADTYWYYLWVAAAKGPSACISSTNR